MTSVVYCRTFLHFKSLSNNLKKTNFENLKSRSFEHRIGAQTQVLQIFKKFNMSQMNPKEVVQQHCILSSTTLHSRSLPLSTRI